MGVAEGEDISTLQGLLEVTKDIVDNDNGLLSVDGASDIYLR